MTREYNYQFECEKQIEYYNDKMIFWNRLYNAKLFFFMKKHSLKKMTEFQTIRNETFRNLRDSIRKTNPEKVICSNGSEDEGEKQ